MARESNAGTTDSTSGRLGRQTISIPADAVVKLDALIARTGEALKATAGITVVLSRAQMVESLIGDAHARPAPDATPAD